MDGAFVARVRSLLHMRCTPGAIARITKRSQKEVTAAISAIRAKPLTPKKVMTITAQMALAKMDRAYRKAGAQVQTNGKIKLNGSAQK